MSSERQCVVEVPEFRSQVKRLSIGDDEVEELIDILSGTPTIGDLIRGTGGVRKYRQRRPGTGKSGGYRVIYFFHNPDMPLFLLTVYPKSEKDNLTQAERNALKQATTVLVQTYKRRQP